MVKHDPLLYLGNPPTKKRCSKCRQYKDMATSYYKGGGCKFGIQARCKACQQSGWRKYKGSADRFWKRYWSKTSSVGDCLEWEGAWTKVPVCRYDGKMTNVRRVVYRLACGEVSSDMFVLPICGNKRCVRHSHLKLMTAEELAAVTCNSAPWGERHGSRIHPDRLARGEKHGFHLHPERTPRGERNHKAKLTENEIRAIRDHADLKVSRNTIAEMFGISLQTVGDILRGKTWTHVQ